MARGLLRGLRGGVVTPDRRPQLFAEEVTCLQVLGATFRRRRRRPPGPQSARPPSRQPVGWCPPGKSLLVSTKPRLGAVGRRRRRCVLRNGPGPATLQDGYGRWLCMAGTRRGCHVMARERHGGGPSGARRRLGRSHAMLGRCQRRGGHTAQEDASTTPPGAGRRRPVRRGPAGSSDRDGRPVSAGRIG